MKTEASLSRLGATEGVNVSVNLMISASTPTRVPSLRCICVMQCGSSQDHQNSLGISVKKQDDDNS